MKKILSFFISAFVFFSPLTVYAAGESAGMAENIKKNEKTDEKLSLPLGESEEKKQKWNFFITPKVSLQNGVLNELLYNSQKNLEHPLTSLLEWQEKWNVIFGTDLECTWKYLYLWGNFSSALSLPSGSMYDSDWFKYTNVKQSYSISENSLKEYYSGEFRAGLHFDFLDRMLTLNPFAGFQIKYINFYAEGGKAWYDPGWYDTDIISYDSPSAVFRNYNPPISYWRRTTLIWLGADFSYSPIEKLNIRFCGKTSPYTKIYSVDHHFYNAKYFTDTPSGFFLAWNAALETEWKFNSLLSVKLGGDFFILNKIYGYTYESLSADSKGDLKGGYSGAEEKTWSFFAGLTFSL